jgi:O-antigen/teichoic acid export membrane protein
VASTSTRTALLWTLADRYANLVVNIAAIMVLSRLLTPAQVGVYSLCAAVTTVAGILRDFGVTEYLIQEKELTRERLRTAFGIAIVIAWSVGLTIFFSRDVIADFYKEAGVRQVLSILSLNFLLLPFTSPAYALLSREMAFRRVFVLQFVGNLTATAVSVTLAYLGFGYLALAWSPVVNVAMQAILMLWLGPAQGRVWPAFLEVRRVLTFGLMFVTSRIVEVFSRNFHEPVVAKQMDFASVGLFSRAYGLVEIFTNTVTSAVVQVATPVFAADNRAGRSPAESFMNATVIFCCVAWPFFCFVALTSREIVGIMFGAQWLAAAPIATVLAVTAIPAAMFALAPQLLSATGHVKRRMMVMVWASLVHVVCVLGAVHISLAAVAWVWFISSSVKLAMFMRETRVAFGLSPWRLISRCGSSAVVTVGSMAAQALVLWLCRRAQVPAILALLATFAAGAAGWWIVARATRHPAAAEVSRVVAGVRQRLAKRARG